MPIRPSLTAILLAGGLIPGWLYAAEQAPQTDVPPPAEPPPMSAEKPVSPENVFPTIERLFQPPFCVACPTNGCADDPLCKPGFIAFGDYLYWKASPTGLDYATVTNPITFTPIATASLDLPRSGGCRVGVGYRFAGTCCDLTCNYTHFQSGDQQSVVANGATTELLLTRSLFSTVAMDSIEADDALNLNIYDVEADWRMCLNDSAAFRGFGGVRLATLDQDFHSNYTLLTNVNGTINLPTRMDAAGIRLGAEFEWRTAWGFRVFGRGASSLLVADFTTGRREADSLHGVIIDTSVETARIVPVLEAAAGIAWTWKHLELSAGYELSNWFNMAGVGDVSGGIGTVPVSAASTIFPQQSLFIDGCFARLTIML